MRWSLVILTACLTTSASRAQADREIQVVVRFEPHRLMTTEFRNQIGQQVMAGLSAAAGDFYRVRFTDFDRNPAAENARAFPDVLSNLDQFPISGRWKIHFVIISFQDGQYRVRSRQTDGALGWCSPVLRDEATGDREFVGRLALDQILRDFGLSGQIAASDGDRTAMVRFNVGNLSDARLASWIRVGDLFAVIRTGKGSRGFVVPNTFLVVNKLPLNGSMECRVESRYVKALSGWESSAFHAVHLGASRGPLRLRVISSTGSPLPELTVRMSATGTQKSDAVREQATIRHGRFVSKDFYDRIGYARIFAGERLVTQLPIAVLGSETTTIELNAEQSGEAAVALDSDVRALGNRLRDLLARAQEENDQLKRLLVERKNRQALGLVNISLRRLDEELLGMAAEVAALKQNASKNSAMAADELSRSVRDLKAHGESLKKTKADLEESLGAGADERLAGIRALIAKAERDERDAEFDAAIATYEDVLKQTDNSPEIARRVAGLKKTWELKSDAHRNARKFIYETWAKADSTDAIEKSLEGARQALATCKQVDDRLSPRKLYLGIVRATDLVFKRDEELRRNEGDEVAKQMESLKRLSNALRTLLDEVEAYLKTN